MKNISLSGLYLVVDPAIPNVFEKVSRALEGGVSVLQIWDHWRPETDKDEFVHTLAKRAHEHKVPVLINADTSLLVRHNLDGIHLDRLPEDLAEIRKASPDAIIGVTCGNDRDLIRESIEKGVDYISFCSMYASQSAVTCEVVLPRIVTETRRLTDIPIFASGGITVENIQEVLELGVDGIALISAILKSDDPKLEALKYNQILQKHIRKRNIHENTTIR